MAESRSMQSRQGAWALVEKGKQLWNSVAARGARTAGGRVSEVHAEIDVRMQMLEQRAAGLEEEAVSSFDVVRSIAEQHSQLAEQNALLAEAVDALRERTRLLAWACAALAVWALVLLILVLVYR